MKIGTSAIGIPLSPPISDDNVVAWAKNLFKKDKITTISQTARVTGDFNVELDNNSVKSNLIREFNMQFRDESNGVQSKASQKRRMSGAVVDISVTVSVYRGKTKVEYVLKHPFELTSDGSIKNYNDKIISTALEQLKKAANA
ncbi:hypothetical protein KO505_08845 [Psychrosphaera sp. F3M07]|uniref:hypothetical protein n=1 Tax=Psychrosphaera sp. F3M07 TaxID=2841560 RepID=UPI001C0A1DAC|nr:hypothetical protein [Psychrosphaera sp. F3M07]MBU2918067.1 hypothetical protein [Psychrosphaera sp. F3M07]